MTYISNATSMEKRDYRGNLNLNPLIVIVTIAFFMGTNHMNARILIRY